MGNYRDLILSEPGLLGYWPLDETSGTVAHDATGAHDGVYVGAVTLGAARIIAAEQFATYFGGANNVYVEVASSAAFHFGGLAPFTLECWHRPQAGGGAASALMHRGLLLDGFSLQIASGGGNVQFMRYVAGVASSGFANPGDTFTASHHYAMTFDGTINRFYVNGVQRNTTADVRSMGADPGGPLRFGHRSDAASSSARGALQGVAIYNAALSAAQIAAHYAVGNVPPLQPPLSAVIDGHQSSAEIAAHDADAVLTAHHTSAEFT